MGTKQNDTKDTFCDKLFYIVVKVVKKGVYMDVKGVWTVELPIQLSVFNSFENSELTIFDFEIKGVACKLLKNCDERIIDRIQVTIISELDDELYPYWNNDENRNNEFDKTKMIEIMKFVDEMQRDVANIIEDFINGFTKSSGGIATRIFNGEDFITKYKMTFEPTLFAEGNHDPTGKERWCISDSEMKLAIEYASKEKDDLDIAWTFLNESEYFADMGKYEVAIINIAIMIEFLVTSKLNGILKVDGKFRDKKVQIKMGGKSFVERYFKYGLNELGYPLPKDYILEMTDIIIKVRNRVIHRKMKVIEALYDVGYIIDTSDLKFHILGFCNDAEVLYKYFVELKNM